MVEMVYRTERNLTSLYRVHVQALNTRSMPDAYALWEQMGLCCQTVR